MTMFQTALAIAQSVAGLVVLIVALGRWTQKVETKPTATPLGLNGTNGSPTLAELTRRVESLERDIPATYVRQDVAKEQIEESRRDRKEMRDLIAALRRLVENLMGS